MHLDHFVIHVENDIKPLLKLAEDIGPMGYPFNPKKGKGTSGFKASNIWVGDQYFEIVRLLKPEGGGWPQEWVDRVNAGKRGISCIFLSVANLEKHFERISASGVACSIEKTEFKILFGLSKMTMPWRYLKLPTIPGMDLDIRFIEYEKEGWEHYQKYMTPNSRDFGIQGIFDAEVWLPDFQSGIAYLKMLFPVIQNSGDQASVALQPGKLVFRPQHNEEIAVRLSAKSSSETQGTWQFLDLAVS